MGLFITIDIDGHSDVKHRDTEVSLEEVQGAVMGWVEKIPNFITFKGKPAQAYCNEEGRIHGMAPNQFATSLWVEESTSLDLPPPDAILVGPIVILTEECMWS